MISSWRKPQSQYCGLVAIGLTPSHHSCENRAYHPGRQEGGCRQPAARIRAGSKARDEQTQPTQADEAEREEGGGGVLDRPATLLPTEKRDRLLDEVFLLGGRGSQDIEGQDDLQHGGNEEEGRGQQAQDADGVGPADAPLPPSLHRAWTTLRP